VPIAPAFGQKFDYLSQQVWDELVQLRLIEDNPRNTGELQPRWTLKTTYYWQQTFPARQETIIDHSYVPSVGSVVALPASQLLSHPESLGIDPSKNANRFCIDQAFLNAMERASNVTWVQRTLSYVLTTGANWSGPIKQFHLTVDKGSPENLISLCIGNIRKTSSTQFEVNASSFLPTSDLNILILEPQKFNSPERQAPSIGQNGSSDLAKLDCDQLWYQRNRIFKSAGYCFRTPKGMSLFGNTDCRFDDLQNLPLSDQARDTVSRIQQLERMRHCQ